MRLMIHSVCAHGRGLRASALVLRRSGASGEQRYTPPCLTVKACFSVLREAAAAITRAAAAGAGPLLGRMSLQFRFFSTAGFSLLLMLTLCRPI